MEDKIASVAELGAETVRKMAPATEYLARVVDQRWHMRERLVAMATVVAKSMRLPSSISKRKMQCGSTTWLHTLGTKGGNVHESGGKFPLVLGPSGE